MNKKKIFIGVAGALLTAAGTILSLVGDIMPDKKEDDTK